MEFGGVFVAAAVIAWNRNRRVTWAKSQGEGGVGERGLVGKKVGFPSRSKSTIKGMGWITKDLLILKDLFHQQFHGRLVDYYFTGRLFAYRGFLLQSGFF